MNLTVAAWNWWWALTRPHDITHWFDFPPKGRHTSFLGLFRPMHHSAENSLFKSILLMLLYIINSFQQSLGTLRQSSGSHQKVISLNIQHDLNFLFLSLNFLKTVCLSFWVTESQFCSEELRSLTLSSGQKISNFVACWELYVNKRFFYRSTFTFKIHGFAFLLI